MNSSSDPIDRVPDRNRLRIAIEEVQTSIEEQPGDLQRTITRIHLLLFSLEDEEFNTLFPFPKPRVVDHLIRIEELVMAVRPDNGLFARK